METSAVLPSILRCIVTIIVGFKLISPCHYSHFLKTHISSSSVHNDQEDFCHINDFDSSRVAYQPIKLHSSMEDAVFYSYLELGKPFGVCQVTKKWKANEKWDDNYFKNIFSNFELFSSTFATNVSPRFETVSRRDVYYGIFLNDKNLAGFLANDYSYPSFIPRELKMQGIDRHLTMHVMLVKHFHDNIATFP